MFSPNEKEFIVKKFILACLLCFSTSAFSKAIVTCDLWFPEFKVLKVFYHFDDQNAVKGLVGFSAENGMSGMMRVERSMMIDAGEFAYVKSELDLMNFKLRGAWLDKAMFENRGQGMEGYIEIENGMLSASCKAE